MALIDDITKEVIDGNKDRLYKDNTKKMFEDWLKSCPVKLVDTTDQRPGYGTAIRTFQAWITVRK